MAKPIGAARGTTPEKRLLVEIIAYAPTAYYHCTHCEVTWREIGATNRIHEEQIESSLPRDLIQEYENVSDWVREMFRVHRDGILLKVIDAASVEGFYKSLLYTLPLYETEVRGTQSLRRMGDALFA